MTYTAAFFDQYLERRNTRSAKWDGCNAKFGVDPSVELIPMWVADMDFRSPTEVTEAIIQRAQTSAYGYISTPDSAKDKMRYFYCYDKDSVPTSAKEIITRVD